MSDGSERRENDRVEFSARVRLKFPGVTALEQYFTQNLSNEGVFIQTPKPLESGREIQLQVVDGEGEVIFEALAVVVWSRPTSASPSEPPGMGLRFTKLEGKSADTIDRIIHNSPRERDMSVPAVDRPSRPSRRSAPTQQPRKPKPAANFLSNLPMEKIKNVQPIVWISVGVGIIALVAASAITVNVVGKSQKKKAYLAQLTVAQEGLNTSIAELDQSQAEWDARRAQLRAKEPKAKQRASKIALSKQQALRMPKKMKANVAQSRYKLSTMTKAPTPKMEGIQEVRFDLEMYGDVGRLKSAMKSLYAHGRAMEVQSVEVSLLNFQTTQCRVKARLIFFQFADDELPSLAEGDLPPRYAALLVDEPIPEEWQGLGGKKITSAQTEITDLRGELVSRSSDIATEERIAARERIVAQMDEQITALQARRDANKNELLELSAKMAKEARTSSSGVARAKIDPTGHLSML